MVKSFEELAKKRLDWVNSSKDNNFDIGLRKLLTDLYPDKAHFIYELIQNAEDAQATEVIFDLKKDHLIFSHNGNKLFSLHDIESITSIANSTKKDDGTSVGKFGVGFKAVYSYTNTPIINSGYWQFKITDMVIPERVNIEQKKNFPDADITYFKFPFNRKEKPKEIAYQEILEGLKNLKAETILFLNNITHIKWINGKTTQIITKVEENHFVLLSAEGWHNQECEYLKFQRTEPFFKIETEDKISTTVSIAYQLDTEIDNNGNKLYKIVPSTQKHNVFIWFPAEKEDSHLKFLINAPFACEISRASIRDTQDNAKLLSILVGLQKESLFWIKDNNMLSTDFLRILPNRDDDLPDAYKGFHSEIIKLFQEESLTPTKTGEFAPASGLFFSEERIDTFLSDDELAQILNLEETDDNWQSPMWVKNASQRNSRADKFLHDLDIRSYGWYELFRHLIKIFDYDVPLRISWYNSEKRNLWKDVLKQKEIPQLKLLYQKVKEYVNNYDYNQEKVSTIDLFLTEAKNVISLNDKPLLKPQGNISNDILEKYDFIHSELCIKNKKEDYEMISIFKELGIKEYSIETLCDELIEKYPDYPFKKIPIEENIKDIKIILQAIKEYPSKRYDLRETSFVVGDDKCYYKPSSLMLGNIYEENDFNFLFQGSKKELSAEYKEKLKKEELTDFILLLKELGIWHEIKIISSNCHDNPLYETKLNPSGKNETDYCRNIDYKLYCFFDMIHPRRVKKASKIIWETIIKAGKDTLTAVYMANNRDSRHECPSAYIYRLKKLCWILDKDGNRNCPEDMTFERLPDGWTIPEDGYNNPVLKAIGFGESETERIEEEKRKNEFAQKAGFKDNQQMEFLAQWAKQAEENGLDIQEIFKKSIRSERQKPTLPCSETKNAHNRLIKREEEFSTSQNQQYEIKERSIRITNSDIKETTTVYLKNEYTNEDDIMICQFCQNELPFKKKNGSYHFESVQIFSKMEREYPYQYLALCPNCAAEYIEWVRNNEPILNELRNVIKNIDISTNLASKKIEVSFNNRTKELYFTGKHFTDLKAIFLSDKKDKNT